MAELDPKNIERAVSELKDATSLLEAASGHSDDLSKNLDIAQKSLVAMQKELSKGNKKLSTLAGNVLADLKKQTDVAGRLNVISEARANFEKELENNNKSARKTAKARREDAVRLKELIEKINAAQKAGAVHTLQQMILSKNMNSRVTQGVKAVQNLGSSFTGAATAFSKIPVVGKAVASVVGGIGTKMLAMGAGPVGWIVTGLLLLKDLGVAIWNVFKQADDAAAKFRKDMGITREFTAKLDRDIQRVAIELVGVGVTFGTMYDSTLALAQNIGFMLADSVKTASTIAILSSQLGVSAEKSAQVLRAFGQISRSTMASQRNMLGCVARLSQAAGTNLHEVMGDIAEFSQSGYRFMRGTATELAKAAVAARRMGTSLSDIAKSSESLINFTQSVTDEMEASVLLGRSIDLQHARTLAYMGKNEDLAKELVRLSQEVDFESLDPIQMRAFATAIGKTEAEISKMLQAEREMADIQRAMAKDPALKAQVKAYEAMKTATKDQARNLGAEYLLRLKTEANQSRMVSIQNKWNALVQQMAEKWLPVIDKFLGSFITIINSKPIQSIIDGLATTLSKLAEILDKFANILPQKNLSKKILGDWSGSINEIEKDIKPGSPHKLGQMFIDGFKNSSAEVERALLKPIDAAIKHAAKFNMGTDIALVNGKQPTTNINGVNSTNLQSRHATFEDVGATESTMLKVVEAVNLLRSELLNGKLSANVYLDSQLVSQATQRATSFRRGYGTNDAYAT